MSSNSWLAIERSSPYSLANIPFGIISESVSGPKSAAIAVGEYAINLKQLARGGAFDGDESLAELADVFCQDTLNAFARLGRKMHERFRHYIRSLLSEDTQHGRLLKDNSELRQRAIIDLSKVINHVPMAIGDYTDFYAGINHAFNVGVLFRGRDNALQPNYLHLPVGYHGRASSIQVSGTPVRRPLGQMLPAPGAKQPIFGPCKKLDIELELAAFLCTDSEQGKPVDISDAANQIFGYVLMNDWSARDIQAWEYVPLGPFNSKNFATSISPWIVLAGALEPFRTALPKAPSADRLLPYLQQKDEKIGFDIPLAVDLIADGQRKTLSRTNAQHLCFSFEQMVAHHSITGCPLRAGDLLGSGTISGPDDSSLGSFLELTHNGKNKIDVADGVTRTFLEDGDEVIISGTAGTEGQYVGFGDVRAKILPVHEI